MSAVTELQVKLTSLKDKLDGDLKDLVVKLESVFHHVHASHVEDVVKVAVATDIHEAATKIDNVANTIRMESDLADKAVDTADDAVNAVVTKK